MKLTKTKLKQLVKEELQSVLNETIDARGRQTWRGSPSGGYNYPLAVKAKFAESGISRKLVSAAADALEKDQYDMMYKGRKYSTAKIVFKAAVADFKNPYWRELVLKKAPFYKSALKKALRHTTVVSQFLRKSKAFAKKAPVIGGFVGLTALLISVVDAWAAEGPDAAGKILAKEGPRTIPELDMMVSIFELAEEYLGVARSWKDNAEHEKRRVERGVGAGFRGHKTME